MKKNLLFAAAALGLLLGALEVQADDRRGYDRGRGQDRNFNRDNRGFNQPGYNRNWDRRDYDRRDYNRRNVSVNVNINDRWRPAYRPYTYSGIGYSLGFGSWGSGFSAWSAPVIVSPRVVRQPVVVYQNTYVNAAPRGTASTYNSGTSLLRDINGRCFERSYDSFGNETRYELPVSACNF